MTHEKIRREIVASCRQMNALGINQGTSGNISARIPGGMLVTPTGVPYDEMTPDMIVEMKLDGTVRGRFVPSSEWRFHRDILVKRPEVNAVVHNHAMFSTTLACLGRSIPAFHYMIAVSGGDSIRCAPYHTYGTQELSEVALQALEGRTACLLANHGMIATGPSLKRAMWLAVEVETLAAQYWRALQIGEPNLLSAAEMKTVIAKFAGYGRQPESKRRRA